MSVLYGLRGGNMSKPKGDRKNIRNPYNERNYLFDQYAFKKFIEAEDPYLGEQLETYIKRAIETYCTPLQRAYIYEYFNNYMYMEDIGIKYGVSKGTVSRVINRGMNNVIKCISVFDPRFKKFVNHTRIVVRPTSKEHQTHVKHKWSKLEGIKNDY